MDHPDTGFLVRITSLEELVAFAAIIRGDDLSTLAERTATLRKSTKALSTEVVDQSSSPEPSS
jgi:hypothetical protein